MKFSFRPHFDTRRLDSLFSVRRLCFMRIQMYTRDCDNFVLFQCVVNPDGFQRWGESLNVEVHVVDLLTITAENEDIEYLQTFFFFTICSQKNRCQKRTRKQKVIIPPEN